MKSRRLALALSAAAVAVATFSANAAIVFQNLGKSGPPATLGAHTMTPFAIPPQAEIAELTQVSSIPGVPGGGSLGIYQAAQKVSRGQSWNPPTTWPGGYSGPVYFSNFLHDEVLLLPPNTKAFYFYVESNIYNSNYIYTATTDSGVSSGAIFVAGANRGTGGNGFAFYSTAGETITSIRVAGQALGGMGFLIGQFGISADPVITCESEGYTGTKLTWCQNICEKGYTGATLSMWIKRWTDRYKDLPYCAREN